MSNLYQIGEIAKVKGGKRLPKGHDFVEQPSIPYLRVVDMINGGIDEADIKYISPQTEKLISNYKIKDQDIYVTIAGTIGNFGVIPSKYKNAQLTENAAKLCEIDLSQFNLNFLIHKFSSDDVQRQIWKFIGIGGGVPKLALHRIQKIEFVAPPLPVQRKIARILSTIDGQIEKTEAIIAKYQAVKQGMLQDLFTRGIDVRTGQLRPRYEDAPALYKGSPLGMIPKEWEVKNVQELSLEVKVGIVIKPTQYYRDAGVPMLRSFNIKAGYIMMTDLVFMSEKDNALQAKSRLCVGDVVSVRTGYPGTTAVITSDVAGCNCIDLVITKVDTELLLPEFLANWTNSVFGMKQIFAKQGGNAQQHFNVGEMKKMLIPAISLQEQQVTTKVTQNISAMVSKEANTLSKLQLLKQGMMQDLLSGKVEVGA